MDASAKKDRIDWMGTCPLAVLLDVNRAKEGRQGGDELENVEQLHSNKRSNESLKQ